MNLPQLVMTRANLLGLLPIEAPAPYAIVPFEVGDEVTAAEVQRLAFSDEGWTPARYREELIDKGNVFRTWLAKKHGVVVASATAVRQDHEPSQGYVHYVGCHPDHAGFGLGWRVTLAVVHEFAVQGCTSAILTTDDWRVPAIKGYLRLGFRPHLTHDSHPDRWAKLKAEIGEDRFES